MQLKPNTLLQGGKYQIIRVLGQGGFGITYLAEQVALHRKVAVKEFFMKDCCERDEATSKVTVGTGSQRKLVEKFRGKFIREAQMIAGFEHPNVVRVLDVFEENGTAYYVMDNLTGGSLKEKIESGGPLSEKEAERYVRQVAEALDYIHSQNTIHLDVKPSNILLNTKGDVVLADFGISKHYDNAGEQTSSTPVGSSKGFAPLEQGRDGDVSQFGPSTDIYALGATLYNLLTGHVPPEATIVNEDGLDRPKGISDRMWNAIESAMQPRRKDRPQTVTEFLELLPSANTDVSEKDDSTRVVVEKEEPSKPLKSPKSPKQSSRKPLYIALVSAAVCAVIAIMIGLILDQVVTTGTANGHDWVDLGLSVKWATCNVGASSPEDYGDFYAWGETITKGNYSWETLKFRVSGDSSENLMFSKYNTISKHGFVDNKLYLDLSDDAASWNWGGRWRTPTKAEWEELSSKCTWTWATQGGKNGYKVTGKNGNSIFLPAAGYWDGKSLYGNGNEGLYLSSSLYTEGIDSAWIMCFYSGHHYAIAASRSSGLSVRPVKKGVR